MSNFATASHSIKHQVGCILPAAIGDFIHYQFYQIVPPSCLLVADSVRVRAFAPDAVAEAMTVFWDKVAFLAKRGVDRLSLAGIPVTAILGRQEALAIIETGKSRLTIPFTNDFEESIEALRHIGARKVAVAAKWETAVMERVATYLRDAGFDVLGYVGSTQSVQDVVALQPAESAETALALGRAALLKYPDADALFLAGGAWLSLPAIVALEAEFAKPVISNTLASCWTALRQFKLRPLQPQLGRLIDSLDGQ